MVVWFGSVMESRHMVFALFFYIKSCKLRGRTVRCYLRPKDNIPVAPFRENSPYKGEKNSHFFGSKLDCCKCNTPLFPFQGTLPKLQMQQKLPLPRGKG